MFLLQFQSQALISAFLSAYNFAFFHNNLSNLLLIARIDAKKENDIFKTNISELKQSQTIVEVIDMFFEQRRTIILELLQDRGGVSLGELVEMFDISPATVRRDLSDMEKQGLLKRTHGGAVNTATSAFERDYSEEQKSQTEEKKSIARVVAQMVNDEESVMLDSGTTIDQIAVALADRKITIITNSATIPPELPDFLPEVYKAGGLYRAMTKSIVGPQAERFIQSFRPDKVFIAANGISENLVTTPHISEGSVKEAMIASAKEKYLVVDHTKFGQEYLSVFAKASEFDAIITDSGIDEATIKFYQSRSIPIITEENFKNRKGMGEILWSRQASCDQSI